MYFMLKRKDQPNLPMANVRPQPLHQPWRGLKTGGHAICGIDPMSFKLVEVTRGAESSDEAIQIGYELAKKISKIPVIVQKDSPDFIYNRVNEPTLVLFSKILERGKPGPEEFDINHLIVLQVNEAAKLIEKGVCTDPKEIDRAMANGGGSPLGPFELAKGIGYETLNAKLSEL